MKWLQEFNLPTDNLYRFMALFGLLSTIFCFAYIPILTNQHNEKMIEYNSVFAELAADISYNEAKIEDKRRLIPKSLKTKELRYFLSDGKDSILTNDEVKSYIFPIIEKTKDTIYNKIIHEINDLYHQTAKKQNKYNVVNNYCDMIDKNLTVVSNYLKLLAFFCLITCIIGMILWYNKYQKYLDMKLKEEALKKDDSSEKKEIVETETKDSKKEVE